MWVQRGFKDSGGLGTFPKTSICSRTGARCPMYAQVCPSLVLHTSADSPDHHETTELESLSILGQSGTALSSLPSNCYMLPGLRSTVLASV